MIRPLSIIVALLLWTGRAWADGALPDAQSILTPGDRPQEIVLATNFGLVLSEDAGKTWLWTCEQDVNAFGWLYQIGLPPRHRIFALANKLMIYSDDLTCSWRAAGGAVAGQEIADAWIDRAVPDRAYVIGVRTAGESRIHSLFESVDGGATFGPAIFVGDVDDTITGVESAVSDPQTLYMTLLVGSTMRAIVAHSTNGGAAWQMNDLSTSLGTGTARLLAVDAQNPKKLFLLWNQAASGQAVAVSEDGGATATIRLGAKGDGAVINAFVQTRSGVVLVATEVDGVAVLHRSRDGGTTFEDVPNPPRVRGLSERGGIIYAAADNGFDGYALGTSADDGTTFVPLMSYDKITAIPACLKAACQASCQMLTPSLWNGDVCTADAPPLSIPDAGVADAGAGVDAASGGGGTSGSGGASPGTGGAAVKPMKSGGGCTAAPFDVDDASWALLAGAMLLAYSARRVARRQRSG